MQTRTTLTAAALFATGALFGWLAAPTAGQEKQPDTRPQPTFTPAQLAERALQRRAVEAVIWGMPAVNYELMYQAMIRETNGSFNQVLYWSRLPDWKNQTLTPNPDVIYLMPFFSTKDVGPVVLEIPPADEGVINGTIMDAWQSPLEDVGPAGVDKGRGGKYLVLPPGYKEPIPAGYIALPSGNWQGYALLRSILKSGSNDDIAKAADYGRRIKLYPLSRAADPPVTKFLDAIDVVFDATIPYDVRFFHSLHRFVQREPWLARDKAMIDPLRSIGIDKDKKFDPDHNTQAILNEAAREAHALIDIRYENVFSAYFDSSRWAFPAFPDYIKEAPAGYADSDHYPIDSRGIVFSFAFFTPKHLGAGQFYLMTIKDKGGNSLDGGSTYRLTVPKNVPVSQYWSATVYDRATHTLIRNMKWSNRSSQTPGLAKNGDGSVDIDFGPQAPNGQESNWVPTEPGGKFEVLFRFYGPETALFDKTWKLPDIEKLK
jgi:hypothetical protein